MEAAPTPSMALCFFGITADSVSHPSDSIRRSLEAPCSVGGGGGCGCVAPEEDGAVAAGDDIAAAVAVSGNRERRNRKDERRRGKREGNVDLDWASGFGSEKAVFS